MQDLVDTVEATGYTAREPARPSTPVPAPQFAYWPWLSLTLAAPVATNR
ncbi:hypothetical protein AB0I69_32240 [Streptomyces sp. NPDC050508]